MNKQIVGLFLMSIGSLMVGFGISIIYTEIMKIL